MNLFQRILYWLITEHLSYWATRNNFKSFSSGLFVFSIDQLVTLARQILNNFVDILSLYVYEKSLLIWINCRTKFAYLVASLKLFLQVLKSMFILGWCAGFIFAYFCWHFFLNKESINDWWFVKLRQSSWKDVFLTSHCRLYVMQILSIPLFVEIVCKVYNINIWRTGYAT